MSHFKALRPVSHRRLVSPQARFAGQRKQEQHACTPALSRDAIRRAKPLAYRLMATLTGHALQDASLHPNQALLPQPTGQPLQPALPTRDSARHANQQNLRLLAANAGVRKWCLFLTPQRLTDCTAVTALFPSFFLM